MEKKPIRKKKQLSFKSRQLANGRNLRSKDSSHTFASGLERSDISCTRLIIVSRIVVVT